MNLGLFYLIIRVFGYCVVISFFRLGRLCVFFFEYLLYERDDFSGVFVSVFFML